MRIVAIGASWGGVSAITTVLGGVPADFAAPIVIVQHRREEIPTRLAETIGRRSPLCVAEANDKDDIEPPTTRFGSAGHRSTSSSSPWPTLMARTRSA
jgi:two-component system chemotaxis response regulator CheB